MPVLHLRKPIGKTYKYTLLGDMAFTGKQHMDLIQKGEGHNLFKEISCYLHQSDCVVANLETVISDSCPRLDLPGILLRSPKASVDILKSAKISIVNLANNHTMDCGTRGLQQTMKHLRSGAIDFFGAGFDIFEAKKIYYQNIGNTKIALIGFTDSDWYSATKRSAGTAGFSFRSCQNTIKRAKTEGANIVMFFFHGGEELMFVPWPKRTEKLRRIADMGADIVVCNHQHFYQGIEIYKGKPVFHSLGNFIMDFDYHRKSFLSWMGCIVTLLIDSKGCFGIETIAVKINPDGIRKASEKEELKLSGYVNYVKNTISCKYKHAKEWGRDCYKFRYEKEREVVNTTTFSKISESKLHKLKKISKEGKTVERICSLFRYYARQCFMIIRHPHHRSIFFMSNKQFLLRKSKSLFAKKQV